MIEKERKIEQIRGKERKDENYTRTVHRANLLVHLIMDILLYIWNIYYTIRGYTRSFYSALFWFYY